MGNEWTKSYELDADEYSSGREVNVDMCMEPQAEPFDQSHPLGNFLVVLMLPCFPYPRFDSSATYQIIGDIEQKPFINLCFNWLRSQSLRAAS
ncbi:hypothetical protein TELCIR_03240 [Teladorsagia circumcincta]|uniref:Uncharacterized protein n=1 Tax=Teladorsagia circumcincta TaxID=45464 RepID=A0A2G9UX63_TELCI|nr:hypothetical protein TELCIR_03240 [Teladorsagia circumcincta]